MPHFACRLSHPPQSSRQKLSPVCLYHVKLLASHAPSSPAAGWPARQTKFSSSWWCYADHAQLSPVRLFQVAAEDAAPCAGLQLVADATNRTAAVLLRPVLDKVAPPVEKKRLLPLKHVQTQAGHAAVLTWLLQQRPCPLALSTVRVPLRGMLVACNAHGMIEGASAHAACVCTANACWGLHSRVTSLFQKQICPATAAFVHACAFAASCMQDLAARLAGRTWRTQAVHSLHLTCRS